MGLETLLLPSEASCSWGLSGPPVAFRSLMALPVASWGLLWAPGGGGVLGRLGGVLSRKGPLDEERNGSGPADARGAVYSAWREAGLG